MKISRYVPPLPFFTLLFAAVIVMFAALEYSYAEHGIPWTGLDTNFVARQVPKLSEARVPKGVALMKFSNSTSGTITVMSGGGGMKTITLPKAPDITPEDLMNVGFDTGAKLGYMMGLKGADTHELRWMIEACKARDSGAVDKWFKEHDTKVHP